MLAKKAVYENGKITFADNQIPKGKMDVIITFLQDKSVIEESKEIRRSFVDKWAGFLKGSELDNWKEDRIHYLQEKHQ